MIKYLGKYTHRIAISNYRLIKIESEHVYFKVRDPKKPDKKTVTKLHVKEFMRRYLLHILPSGFVRIRHFGILGNRFKKENISIIRKLNNIINLVVEKAPEDWKTMLKRVTGINVDRCPKCTDGEMIISGVHQSFFSTA